jgi:transposase InsO family protein
MEFTWGPLSVMRPVPGSADPTRAGAMAVPGASAAPESSSGLLHHADRGSQYASHASQDMLADHGIVCRMSGKGECLDNAGAERFCGS